MIRAKRPLAWLVWAAASAGLTVSASALWMPAKAQLAQHLLKRAWAKTQETGALVRPWPWADMGPAYRLRFDRLGEEQIILSSASGEALAFGPGWLETTARPGGAGLSVISGHRDTHFGFLKDAKVGDTFTLEDKGGGLLAFKIEVLSVVDAQTSGLDRHMLGRFVALTTCFPFGSLVDTDQRFVVLARQIAESNPTGQRRS